MVGQFVSELVGLVVVEVVVGVGVIEVVVGVVVAVEAGVVLTMQPHALESFEDPQVATAAGAVAVLWNMSQHTL